MRKKVNILILILIILTFPKMANATNWVPVEKYVKRYPLFISGIQIKSLSNITEPKPQKSSYLEVISGGVILIERGAGLFLNTKIIKKPTSKIYFKIEYPNPINPNQPLINDLEYEEGMEELHFSSPDVIWGLKGYHDYLIKVTVYESKNSSIIVDRLEQKVRSYVDTNNREILIFKKLVTK